MADNLRAVVFFFSVKGLLMCIVYRHFDIFKALSIIIFFHELWGP